MKPSYEIVPFNANTRPPVRDLARLHTELLPNSPVPLLGSLFMQRFYYAVLPRENLLFGAVAYVDGHPAGFVVATHDSAGFMRSALRRHLFYLIWLIGISILLEPKRIGAVWEAWQIMSNRPPTEINASGGEILSLGILPAYRSPRFIRQSNLHISTDLISATVAQLKARGTTVISVIVDADNTPAKLFYHGLGWSLKRTSVPGWRTPSVEFICQP